MFRLLTFFIFFTSTLVFGQTFPDTLAFNKPEEIISMNSIDTNRFEIIDTLTNLKTYIIKTKIDIDPKFYLVIKRNGFTAYGFQVPIDQWLSDVPKIKTVTSCNLDAHGKEEIFIYWDYHTGSGGLNGGFSDYYDGCIIWNLNKLEYINLITSRDYSHWSIDYPPDSLYEEEGLRVTVDEAEKFKFSISCMKGKLTVNVDEKTKYHYIYKDGILERTK